METENRKKKKTKWHIPTDIDFSIESPALKKALLIIGLLLVLVLAGYHILQSANDSLLDIETVTAVKTEYVKSLQTEAFIVRDERYIQGGQNGGYVVALVEDGTKVSGNDSVVNIFRSESDAQSYFNLQAVESDIAYYENIQNTAVVNTLSDISSYDARVEDGIYALIGAIDRKDPSQMSEYTDAFRAAVTKRNIAVGNRVDVSETLSALYAQRTQLRNKQIGFTSIPADVAGYYVNSVDGYESACGVYDNMVFAQDSEKLTAKIKTVDTATVQSLLELKPTESNSRYGKLITGFIWYIVCNVPTESVSDFYIGQRLQVSFPDELANEIEVKVAAMNADGTGQTALVLSATAMDAQYANLRKVDVVIALETYTGFKVDQTAMRVVDGENGVYVLLGNVIRFRKVESIYSEEEFHIVDASGQSGYLKPFDEIILGGTQLYDGKLVR